MMQWILQENIFKEDKFDDLISVLERFKIKHSVHKVIPFIGELLPAPEISEDKVICFGSYSMRHAARSNNWLPGVYDLFDQTFEVQREKCGELMLNYDSKVVAFKDAIVTEDTFIRPIDDSKYFAGNVFSAEEFNDWQRKVVVLKEDYGTSLTGDTLIQLSVPKKIYAEYRFWIIDRIAVTCSLYKQGHRVIYSANVDLHIREFVNKIIGRAGAWQPAEAYVLDVCETPEGLKIVEINTINAAGFYAGSVQDIVLALENLNKGK